MRTATMAVVGFTLSDEDGNVLFSSGEGSINVKSLGPATEAEIEEARAVNLAIDEADELESILPMRDKCFKWAHEDDSESPARKGELSAAWEKVMLKIQLDDSAPKTTTIRRL